MTCVLPKCYDVRFPEMSLVLAQQGAHILTFPSAFTQVTGSAHWEVCFAWPKYTVFYNGSKMFKENIRTPPVITAII